MWWIISSLSFILQGTLFVSKVSAALLRYVLNCDLIDIGALVCCGLLLATVVYGVTHQLVLRKPSLQFLSNKVFPHVVKAAASPALRSLSALSSLFSDTLLWVACGIAVLLCEVLSTLNVLCWGLCIVAAYTLFAFLQGVYCVFRTIDYVILEVYYLGENTWESFYKVNHELVQSARDPILSAATVITKTASTSVEFSLHENRALVRSVFGPVKMDEGKEVQAVMRVSVSAILIMSSVRRQLSRRHRTKPLSTASLNWRSSRRIPLCTSVYIYPLLYSLLPLSHSNTEASCTKSKSMFRAPCRGSDLLNLQCIAKSRQWQHALVLSL